MSSIDNLFGKIDSAKIESNVNDIFSKKSNALDSILIKAKLRTILPSIKNKRKAKNDKDGEEEQDVNDVDTKDEEPVVKKQKKKADEDDLEGRYYAKLMDDKKPKARESDNNNDDDDENTENVKPKKAEKAKKLDLKEDELEKAERTIFVGNLTNDVIISKTTYKVFKKLFSTDPNPKENDESEEQKKNLYDIESIRFRSISFEDALPRKIAFAQQKLHQSRESVNAYIVYKNKYSVRPLLKKLNASVFENRHLRVDSVSHPAPHDKQRSIFVGNLNFEEDEESLWNHFKTCGEIEYVRIIRDSKTNMGKGFAYVQFYELQSVNKALLLNDKPMITVTDQKKKGRKLRISRCRNMRKERNNQERPHQRGRNFDNLNESQKTKMGRAGKILGKADKATLGKQLTIEGLRATKGEKVSHLKRKKQRSKSGRVTKRSMAFKKAQKDK